MCCPREAVLPSIDVAPGASLSQADEHIAQTTDHLIQSVGLKYALSGLRISDELGSMLGLQRLDTTLLTTLLAELSSQWRDASQVDAKWLVWALQEIRRDPQSSKPSALAVYIQVMFLLVAGLFWIFAGDGRFAEGSDNESLIFLLRAWVWPEGMDFWLFVGLGFNSAAVAYCLSAAYRSADAATIAPFEYTGLLLAVFWSWAIWGYLPGIEVKIGIFLIMASGLFVFLRERQRNRPMASDPPAGTGATRR